ncbi:branched-chain amino acid ABC transporter substrate-binding protein [Paramagnetospirillum kuznetsovii]|uniref:Branched-chain amino acid ABC transporter substrate-binding protein n=1 Tax=Paramagnetospirillum kuznetsovii TaxID=2053833 RepID=A0A364NY40_9PROT|nr:ABC transporter substrate-binding protein [Paramagnetospirillum kuznetsovii]RAU22004.1 branched-chain amino acid ABC transporter substrate-binding protein [Paramagnetospirillum kuznetsovii]
MKRILFTGAALAALAVTTGGANAADGILVGHIADITGATSSVGKPYGQGIADAMNYINAHGGINGQKIIFETVDYAYEVPRAMAAYKKLTGSEKAVAIQGWGTGDTEALVTNVAKDEIPYFSASYSGHLTDPQGKTSVKGAPYNFFYGPSYSDGCRGLVQWAHEDWKKKGGTGKAKFVHMGDNHPYPNSPKQACGAYAKELGFDVLNEIQYSLKPGDFKAQCLSLKESGANYAYLANTSGSTISLLKSCETVGVNVQFLANIWGTDEGSLKTAGEAADKLTWVVGAATWADDVPGMKLVKDISKVSDASGAEARPVHYIRAICSVYYMKEAMEAAAKSGGITGPNIKKAMYGKKDWVPAGLEGVCLPSTWTAEDHRGTTAVKVYQASTKGGNIGMKQIYTAEIPRRKEWLGW